jgi:hypothetical protein
MLPFTFNRRHHHRVWRRQRPMVWPARAARTRPPALVANHGPAGVRLSVTFRPSWRRNQRRQPPAARGAGDGQKADNQVDLPAAEQASPCIAPMGNRSIAAMSGGPAHRLQEGARRTGSAETAP